MPRGRSKPFRMRRLPYQQSTKKTTLPHDCFKYAEGKPPSLGSPLVPYFIHSYYYQKTYLERLRSPIFPWTYNRSYEIAEYDATGNQYRRDFSVPIVINTPTFMKDSHLISVRRQVENFWAMRFYGHIHLTLNNGLKVFRLGAVSHGMAEPAMMTAFWVPGIGSRIVSMDGSAGWDGHMHLWNAKSSGGQEWVATLRLDHGGSIPPEQGHYTIIDPVKYKFKVTEYYRTVFSQDSMNFANPSYDINARGAGGNFMQGLPNCQAPPPHRVTMLWALMEGRLYVGKNDTIVGDDGVRHLYGDTSHGFGMSTCSDSCGEEGGVFLGSNIRTHSVTTSSPFVWAEGGADGFPCLMNGGSGGPEVDALKYFQKYYEIDGEGMSGTLSIKSVCTDKPSELGLSSPIDDADNENHPEGTDDRDKFITMLIGTHVEVLFYITIKDDKGNYSKFTISDCEYSEVPTEES